MPPQTILIVEDHPELRELMESLLTQRGYRTIGASCATEALHVSESVNLLLTDLVMPEMNGSELAHRLMSRDPNLKVLIMSGYPRDFVNDQIPVTAGFDFIQKPMTARDLTGRIESLLTAA